MNFAPHVLCSPQPFCTSLSYRQHVTESVAEPACWQPLMMGAKGQSLGRKSFPATPPPKRSQGLLALAALLLILSGCARMSQTLTTTTTATNGAVEIRESRVVGFALFDSKNTFDALRVSNGKTHSIGLKGVDQEATSTNAVEALRAIDSILGKVR